MTKTVCKIKPTGGGYFGGCLDNGSFERKNISARV